MQNYGSFLYENPSDIHVSVSVAPTSMDTHWQRLGSGKDIISLSLGNVGIHLSPMDALKLADMLERTVSAFHEAEAELLVPAA